MTLNFVSTSTSSVVKKEFNNFPKLKKDEKRVVTFINQTKEFDPKSEYANDPLMAEVEYYYYAVPGEKGSYFTFSDSVSSDIKSKILAKESVKKNVRVLANLLVYTTDSTGKVNNIDGLYIVQLGKQKVSTFDEIVRNARFENPTASLYDFDFSIKCEDEQYQNWTIASRGAKTFFKMDQEVQNEYLQQGKLFIENSWNKLYRALDDDALIEKFDLYLSTPATKQNAMAQAASETSEFAGIKKPSSNPFSKQ